MTKTVTNIDCPFDWIGTDDYSSHLPMLWMALKNTDGKSVVELGCGKGSTKQLSKDCKKTGRNFQSYENIDIYANRYPTITMLISDYMNLLLHNPSVLFIDSAPGEQRKELVDYHRDNADVIILHDTEIGCQSIYGITDVLKSFKYHLHYVPEGLPATSALSNKIDVTQWLS